MFITKVSLDRRTFLRGAGAMLALPVLDAMTPAFAAVGKAKTGALAVVPRLGFIYIPNGVNLETWRPVVHGTDLTLSPTLSALKPFRDQMTLMSGLAHHAADRMNDGAGDHSRATAVFLSGCHAKRTQGADLHLGVTADQIAAKSIGKETRFRSLEFSPEA
jgi:hypothetical protein